MLHAPEERIVVTALARFATIAAAAEPCIKPLIPISVKSQPLSRLILISGALAKRKLFVCMRIHESLMVMLLRSNGGKSVEAIPE